MIDKKHNRYEELFEMMERESKIDFIHREITLMGDYEISSMSFFPKCVVKKLCYFHTTQNIFRKSNKLSKEEYNKRESFFRCSRSLMMLPYVPIYRIENVFDIIQRNYTSPLEKELINYFSSNYLNGNYDRSQWNVVDAIINTNNALESFHSSIN